MKITKGTISFAFGVAAGLLGLKLVSDIRAGKDYDPTDYVVKKTLEERSGDAAAIVKDYEDAKVKRDAVVSSEDHTVKKIVREFKNKTGYDEKVATIRKNTSDLISEYKDSINYDENVSKIRRECDEKIKEAKAKAQISFRLNQNEMDQRKVKNSYEMAKLGFTIVGGDNEFGKAAVEKAEKQRDEEIKRLKKEHSDIEGEAKSIRERYEAEREEKLAALKFDLDKREESYKSMERTDLDLLDKQVREETKSAREFVESIRPEDDTSILEDYDRKYMRYCTLRNNENYSVQSVVNGMDANDRAACYLAQNGWTKASVQIVLFGGIAAVCCAVAGPVFKGIKTIIDISNRMSKFA